MEMKLGEHQSAPNAFSSVWSPLSASFLHCRHPGMGLRNGVVFVFWVLQLGLSYIAVQYRHGVKRVEMLCSDH